MQGSFGLLSDINLAGLEPLDQILRRQIDQLDIVGSLQDVVGESFPDRDAGDLGDHVIQAFQVLHIESGVDIDARFEQFLDILPAFGVAKTFSIGMSQLVDQDQLRPPSQSRVEIELFQVHAAVGNETWRQDFQPLEQRFRLRTVVRLHIADDHMDPFGSFAARGFEHGAGLAHAGCVAKEDFHLPTP